jgi:hypothetical protein
MVPSTLRSTNSTVRLDSRTPAALTGPSRRTALPEMLPSELACGPFI